MLHNCASKGSNNETVSSGFTAIGAGHWDWALLTYANLGKSTLYWTSEEFDPEWRAYYSLLWSDQDKAELARSYKKTGGSCRCLKD